MAVQFTNNASSRLAVAISSSATSLSVAAGEGAKFPSLAVGDWFPVTLIKASGELEILQCTARSGDILTVARGAEGTSARAFAAGDRIELRLTAAMLKEIGDNAIAAVKRAGDTMTGTLTLPGLEVGTTALGGYIDFHQTGGHGDYDARLTCDQASSGTLGAGRVVLQAAAGFQTNGPISSNDRVYSMGGFNILGQNTLHMRCMDTDNSGNLHLWFYDYSGAERALMHVDNLGVFHWRAKGGSENLSLSSTGGLTVRSDLFAGGLVRSGVTSGTFAQMDNTGNIYSNNLFGSQGSKNLTAYLTSTYIQRSNLGNDIVGYASSVGGIGTYAFLRNPVLGNMAPGASVNGPQMTYAWGTSGGSTSPIGTWRCMGECPTGGSSLFLRIS